MPPVLQSVLAARASAARRILPALVAAAWPCAFALAQTWTRYPERAPPQPMPPGGWPGGANDPHYYLKLLVGTIVVVAAWLLLRRLTGYRFPKELPDEHPWWKPPPSAGRSR